MNPLTTFVLFAWVSFVQFFDRDDVSVKAPQASLSTGFPDLYEASISELQEGLELGQFTSVDLVKVDDHQ
jgi:amidase